MPASKTKIPTRAFSAGNTAADIARLGLSLDNLIDDVAALAPVAVTGAYADLTGKIILATTTTAVGTTTAQTINKPSGTVNIAAAGMGATITNSLVSAASLVYCVIRTADTTARIRNVVPAAGSFTITLDATATAEISVGFVVFN